MERAIPIELPGATGTREITVTSEDDAVTLAVEDIFSVAVVSVPAESCRALISALQSAYVEAYA